MIKKLRGQFPEPEHEDRFFMGEYAAFRDTALGIVQIKAGLRDHQFSKNSEFTVICEAAQISRARSSDRFFRVK